MACSRGCSKKSKVDASSLNRKIDIQSVSQTTDGAGGYTEAWATVASVWASIEPASGGEKWVAMQTETHTTHIIMCRYQSVITTAKRILYGTRVFDIVEVINVEENNTLLKIRAIEGTL